MRELDALEFQAVAGGRLAPAPAPRHPIAALVVAILRAIYVRCAHREETLRRNAHSGG